MSIHNLNNIKNYYISEVSPNGATIYHNCVISEVRLKLLDLLNQGVITGAKLSELTRSSKLKLLYSVLPDKGILITQEELENKKHSIESEASQIMMKLPLF